MKLVTYNIQYGIGHDGSFDLERIADAVRAPTSSRCRK